MADRPPAADEETQGGPEFHARRARSFGAVAEDYERYRPGYPHAAVDWLLPPSSRMVADVGAGTGKLTGSLLARGLQVVAIEPDAMMAGVLQRTHPTAQIRIAGADALPLADRSVDAVLVAQAWHWFPHELAAAEVRRVLRPDGWLGLVWNRARPEEPWQVEVERLTQRGRPPETPTEHPEVLEVEGLPSAELESASFPWVESLIPGELGRRMATFSHIALLPEAQRDDLLHRAVAVAEQEAARLGSPVVPFRQTADCVRWRAGR